MSASDRSGHPQQAGLELEGCPAGEEESAVAMTPGALATGSDREGVLLALDAIGLACFEHDSGSPVPRLSGACRQMLGFSPLEDATAGRLLACIHPDDLPLAAPVWLPQAASTADDLAPQTIEHRILLPDGTIRWLKVSGHLRPAGDGGVRGSHVVCDITESRLTRQSLAECNAQLQAFVEATPAPCSIFDRNMRCVAVTERHLLGHPGGATTISGQAAEEVFPDMPPHWRDAHRRALQGEVQRCDCDPITRQDGTRAWVRWELHPWAGADGEIGGLILFAEHLTGRMQAEQALRDNRARLELAIHASQLGVYEWDMRTGIAVCDARLREIFGFAPEETVTCATFLQHIHPQDREGIERRTRAAVSAGNGSVIRSDYRVITHPGAPVRWVDGIGRVSREEPARIVGVVRDITARKRTELALVHTTRELRRADRRKDLYLATLAHELRNPLSPISTVADLLASPQLPPGKLEWMAQVLSRQTTQMVSLLEDLLEISRICSGRLLLRRQDVPLTHVAQLALESVRLLITQKRHRLHVSLPDPPRVIHVDPARISQVLSNLLANAAKYTDRGGDIRLSCAVDGEDLAVRVADNGIGIAAGELERIFTMFWQADRKPERSRGGLGIGLAFARHIAELHGGSLKAHSDGPGRGSELTLLLPACVRPLPVEAAGTPAVPQIPVTLSPRRVLVADDDRDAVEALKMLLTVAGHEVRVALGGPEAIEAARAFRPEVAVLDLSMPGLDGCGVARLLRAEPWAAGLQLIALTGWGQPDVLRAAGSAGFDAQLVKPTDPERLCRLIDAR